MAAYEPGKYTFHVTNQGFGESKEKRTPFFFLEGTPSDPNVNYSRTITLYITDKTADAVADKLKAIGWLGGKWTTLDPNSRSFHSFIGQDIEAICKHEPGISGDGKLYEKWELPFGAYEHEPMESNATVAGKLDKLFGKAAMPSKGKPPVDRSRKSLDTSLAEAGELEAAVDPDDIPF